MYQWRKNNHFRKQKVNFLYVFRLLYRQNIMSPAHLRVDTGKAGIYHVERLRRIWGSGRTKYGRYVRGNRCFLFWLICCTIRASSSFTPDKKLTNLLQSMEISCSLQFAYTEFRGKRNSTNQPPNLKKILMAGCRYVIWTNNNINANITLQAMKI